MTAYSPTTWVNNTPPPLSATNLNKLTDELESQASAKSVSHSLPTWTNGSSPALTDSDPLNEMERVCAAVATAVGLNYSRTYWSSGWTPARNAQRLNALEQQAKANRDAIDQGSGTGMYRNSVWTSAPGAVDPASSSIIPFWLNYAFADNRWSMGGWNYAIATAVSSPSDKVYTVTCTGGGNKLDASFRIPAGTQPAPGENGGYTTGDFHLSVYDPVNRRAHDMWEAVYNAATDTWTCSGGQSASVDGDGNPFAYNVGGYGASAARFALQSGMIRPEEIGAGYIGHALHFCHPKCGYGLPRWPATWNAPSAPDSDSRYIVEGTRMQLDPAINVNNLAILPWEKTIARALQEFGMFYRDTGGGGLYSECPINRGGKAVWAAVGITISSSGWGPLFSAAFPWSSMRVVQAPPMP